MGTRENDREADPSRRKAEVAAREADLAKRLQAAQTLLAAADKRERDLDLSELLAPPDQPGYGDDWPERRNAGLDRAHAKEDRTASHDDRVALTEGRAEDETDR